MSWCIESLVYGQKRNGNKTLGIPLFNDSWTSILELVRPNLRLCSNWIMFTLLSDAYNTLENAAWSVNIYNAVAFTRRVILFNWKNPKPGSHAKRLKDVLFHLQLENM